MTMLATEFESRTSTAKRGSFVLYWRFRPAHPWNVEDFSERAEAYSRFFKLVERGIDARLEVKSEW
jgi:hypothetical protein